jgi:hypothetical protein
MVFGSLVMVFGSMVRYKHFQGMLKVVMMERWRMKAGDSEERCKRLMVKQLLRDRHSLSL